MALLRVATLLLTYGLTRRVAPPGRSRSCRSSSWRRSTTGQSSPNPTRPGPRSCSAWRRWNAWRATSNRAARSGSPWAPRLPPRELSVQANIGALTSICPGRHIVLRPRVPLSAAMKTVQVLFALGAAAAVTMLMLPAIDALFVACLLLPFFAALALALCPSSHTYWQPLRRPSPGHARRPARSRLFCVVTAAWIVPLAVALGPRNVPFNLFLGSINEASIATPLDPLSPGIHVVALIAIWGPVLLVRTRQRLSPPYCSARCSRCFQSIWGGATRSPPTHCWQPRRRGST